MVGLELVVLFSVIVGFWLNGLYTTHQTQQLKDFLLVALSKNATKDEFENAVERANRRVLQAHEARFSAVANVTPRDTTPIAILFKDHDEKDVEGSTVIAAWQRRPILVHSGQRYTATRQDGNVWIYKKEK